MGKLVPPRGEVVVGPREHFTALHPHAGHCKGQHASSPKGEHLCIAARRKPRLLPSSSSPGMWQRYGCCQLGNSSGNCQSHTPVLESLPG